MWSRKIPPEYRKSTTSDFERMQWACGIPAKYWNTQISSLTFATATYTYKKEEDIILPNIQKEYFHERVKNADLLLANRFVCITSTPSTDQALAAACMLVTSYIEARWNAGDVVKARIDDIQDYEKCLEQGQTFYSVEPDIVAFYNLNENSGKERLRLAADVINKFEGCYRIIVAAHDSPLGFARDFLRMEPQEVYHFEGKCGRMVR